MCGIAGVRGDNADKRTQSMLPLMIHRGPDGKGLWSHNDVALGHRRLAINDLSDAGAQPMLSADQSIVITVNGEIYNYPDLKKELASKGCIFRTSCDSEVILHAWKTWQFSCFERFNGMFAIGLYDCKKNILVLARDRLGIKPLYFHNSQSEGLVFASETKALLAALTHSNPAIDRIGLSQYLSYQNTFGKRTLRSGIFLLPPGTLLISQGNDIRFEKYWNLSFSKPNSNITFTSAVDEYKSTFTESVKRHLMSDVPVASYLSAGFDSASVANRASQLGTPPICFTGTFPEGGWYDESAAAKEMAAHSGSDHISVSISYQDVPRVFDKLIYALDEPRMGMGALPQYCVAEKAAASHKVILTGHGGDELFSGYPVFKLVHLMSEFTQKPVTALKKLTQLRYSEAPHLAYFLWAKMRSAKYHQFLPVLFSSSMLKEALNGQYRDAVISCIPESELLELDASGYTSEQKLYSHYLQAYLNGLLVVEDKLSMAHSLESRTPMLDNTMLDMSLKISQHIKMNRGKLKAIIKAGGKDWLPASLYAQPKRGFPTPLRFWLRGPLKPWFEQRITGKDSALSLLFNTNWLANTYSNYVNSAMRHIRPLDEIQSHRMWQLLSLESWLRQSNIS